MLKVLRSRIAKIAGFLEEHPCIRILDAIAKCGILIAAISWVCEIDDRAEQRELQRREHIYRAWQVMASAELMPQSPARRMAMEDLLKYGEVFAGVDLRNTPLDEGEFESIRFERSYIAFVSFDSANLKAAQFANSYLEELTFRGADLSKSEFRGAIIVDSDFTGAKGIDTIDFSESLLVNVKGLPNAYHVPAAEVLETILDASRKTSDWLDEEDVQEALERAENGLQKGTQP